MTHITLTSPFKANSTFTIPTDVLEFLADTPDAIGVVNEKPSDFHHPVRWWFSFHKELPEADFVFEAVLPNGTKLFGVMMKPCNN